MGGRSARPAADARERTTCPTPRTRSGSRASSSRDRKGHRRNAVQRRHDHGVRLPGNRRDLAGAAPQGPADVAHPRALRRRHDRRVADRRRRRAFPKNKAELLPAPQGDRMFEIARQGLVDMAGHIPAYRGAASRPDKFCHGFGIFQLDLQFFKTEPDYFLSRRYADFDAALARCVGELKCGAEADRLARQDLAQRARDGGGRDRLQHRPLQPGQGPEAGLLRRHQVLRRELLRLPAARQERALPGRRGGAVARARACRERRRRRRRRRRRPRARRRRRRKAAKSGDKPREGCRRRPRTKAAEKASPRRKRRATRQGGEGQRKPPRRREDARPAKTA